MSMRVVAAALIALAPAMLVAARTLAAETYVSVGLGVTEESLEMNSLAPNVSFCSVAAVPEGFPLQYCPDLAAFDSGVIDFDFENAFAGFLSVGMDWGSWRLELEFQQREHAGDSPGTPRNPLDLTAAIGIGEIGFPILPVIQPPQHEILRLNSRQLFLNGYYGFPAVGAWRPHLGVGLGVARLRYRYTQGGGAVTFVPSLDDVYWIPENGAGAIEPLSIGGFGTALDTEVDDNVLGMQVIVGVERALAEQVSVFANLRWSRFESSDALRSPGDNAFTTPSLFVSGQPLVAPGELDAIGGFALGAGLRYSF